MTQHGPRDLDAVIDARYWLTDKGWAAAEEYQQTQQNDTQENPT